MASPPDMEITAYDKDRKQGAKVGVGWSQDDGSINLVLNPGSALLYGTNMIYKVKPRATADTSQGMPLASESTRPQRYGFVPPAKPAAAARPASGFDDMDDDIPF